VFKHGSTSLGFLQLKPKAIHKELIQPLVSSQETSHTCLLCLLACLLENNWIAILYIFFAQVGA
jgi:hypothetical protein